MSFPKFLKIVTLANVISVNLNGKIVQKNVFDVIDSQLTDLLSQALGFSYELFSPSDGEMGRRGAAGNWTDMIGMLVRGQVDLAVSKLALTEERNEILPFSYPYPVVGITFATRKPEYVPSILAFLSPFSVVVWISVILCIVSMPFILHGLIQKRYSFQTLMLNTYSTLLHQSFGIKPRKIREYILIAFWMLAAMFLSNSYTALLLSYMTFPPLPFLIHTISDSYHF